jgi:DNA-binding transcriptional MerR regulator
MPKVAVVTSSQAARELGVSPERVRQLAKEGRLAAIDTPLGRLFDPADVERLRLERKGQPA